MGACCTQNDAVPELSKSRHSIQVNIEKQSLINSDEKGCYTESNITKNGVIQHGEMENVPPDDRSSNVDNEDNQTQHINEIFGYYDSRLQLISDRVIRNETNEWCSCLGSLKIDSRFTPNSVYKWVIKVAANRQFALGIIAHKNGHKNGRKHCNDIYVKEYLFGHDKYSNYAWTWNDKFTLTESDIFNADSSFEDAFRPNFKKEMSIDKLITMELDLKKKTIRYFVNDKDYGIAFENVDVLNKELQLGISFKCASGDIEIVSCEICNNY